MISLFKRLAVAIAACLAFANCASRLHAQQQDLAKNFRPASRSWSDAERAQIKERHQRFVAQYATDEKNRKFADELVKERQERLGEHMDYELLLSPQTELSAYVNAIMDRIRAANPQVKEETRLYVSAEPKTNAFSMGEGTFQVLIGLISRCETEAELAFVLSHELAHLIYDHSHRGHQAFEQIYTKEEKREMRREANSDYGKFLSRMRTASANYNKHRRDHEFEADSMGLRMLSKTSYNTADALSVMTMLEKADELKYKDLLDFKAIFNHPAFPFKDEWLAYSVDKRWYQDFKVPDSLQTHPACAERREALAARKDLSGGASGQSFVTGEENFRYHRALAEFEMIETYFRYRAYGLTLFWSLMLQRQYPDNVWLHARAAQSLYYLHLYQQEHNLEQALILPDQRLDENYNRFLTLLNDLRLSQLAQLAYHYADARGERFGKDEEFLYGWVLCSSLLPDKGTHEKLKAHYLKHYPQGRYAEHVRAGAPFRPLPLPGEGIEKASKSKSKKK